MSEQRSNLLAAVDLTVTTVEDRQPAGLIGRSAAWPSSTVES
jgi:hypothetical protein